MSVHVEVMELDFILHIWMPCYCVPCWQSGLEAGFVLRDVLCSLENASMCHAPTPPHHIKLE